jgi:hypothetical protein
LRQSDQTRTDLAAIEAELEVIQAQLARLPTRKELAPREQVIAAQASAKTAKVAAWAALTAALTTAVGVIAQVIVADIEITRPIKRSRNISARTHYPGNAGTLHLSAKRQPHRPS